MICLNCKQTFEGDYCPHCGQQAQTKRLHFIEMINNFVGSFVGGDNKFLCTCRDLILRPGHMVRQYLLGQRIGYYNPLQLFVFALTAYAILSYVLGVSNSIFDEMTVLDFETETEPSKYASLDYILHNITKLSSNKLYGAIVLALFASVAYRQVFRKCKLTRCDGRQLALNLTEQFYAQMYHSCIGLFLSVVMLPLCLIPGLDDVLTIVYQIIDVAYIIVLYRQLLGIKWWKSIVLNLIGLFLAMLLFLVVLMLITVPAGVVEGIQSRG
ncbi:MAG: DUF3667 domain-containing protein [Bacteroidaceae bacterium]|nr:DUF3667 domain-containing protein [Bacteroidaceae bacterium]